MKTLVIYYSYSGNTKFAAQIVASELHADLEELRPQKALHASGAGYVVWGGFASLSVRARRRWSRCSMILRIMTES